MRSVTMNKPTDVQARQTHPRELMGLLYEPVTALFIGVPRKIALARSGRGRVSATPMLGAAPIGTDQLVLRGCIGNCLDYSSRDLSFAIPTFRSS